MYRERNKSIDHSKLWKKLGKNAECFRRYKSTFRLSIWRIWSKKLSIKNLLSIRVCQLRPIISVYGLTHQQFWWLRPLKHTYKSRIKVSLIRFGFEDWMKMRENLPFRTINQSVSLYCISWPQDKTGVQEWTSGKIPGCHLGLLGGGGGLTPVGKKGEPAAQKCLNSKSGGGGRWQHAIKALTTQI